MESSFLNLSNRNFAEIPAWVDQQRNVDYVDVSHNSLTDLRFLYGFNRLKVLSADYNEISSLQTCPKLPNLDTLTLNSNQISDVDGLVHEILEKLPRLDNLSLMKNPCCPYFNIGVTEADITAYRLRIISKLPKLKILDGSAITSQERLDAVSYQNSASGAVERPSTLTYEEMEKKQGRVTAKVKKPSNKKKAISEGNRFITNEEL